MNHRMGRSLLVTCALVTTLLTSPFASGAVAAPAERRCEVPAADEPFETAAPEEVGLDPAAVADAVGFANGRLRTSIRVFRHNCLVSTGALNFLFDAVPWDMWSSTKSVVSLAAGIAVDRGLLDLDDPVSQHVPAGWVDEAHADITVRHLLEENSGLATSILAEAGTFVLDTDAPRAGLALPVEHEPGTRFEYGQRNPDIAARVVQEAVGEDFQAFVQREIFTPIGIQEDSYLWLRDRSGNTYGYAHLFMRPTDFARVGLLLLNDGQWADDRIVSSDYLDLATSSSPTNACYGMLFWVNAAPCISPDIPARRTSDVQPLPGFGDDAYATVGFLQQNNFVSPSRDTLVSWTGAGGDLSLDPQTLLTANPHSELYHEFFRRLAPAFGDGTVVPPYEQQVSLEVNPKTVADVRVALGAVGAGPFAPQDCLLATCDGELPVTGLVQNGAALIDLIVHLAGVDVAP